MSQQLSDPQAASAPTGYSTAIVKQLDIYTLMLLIALLALVAGTFILFFELRRWGSFPAETPWDTSSVQAVARQVWDSLAAPTLRA